MRDKSDEEKEVIGIDLSSSEDFVRYNVVAQLGTETKIVKANLSKEEAEKCVRGYANLRVEKADDDMNYEKLSRKEIKKKVREVFDVYVKSKQISNNPSLGLFFNRKEFNEFLDNLEDIIFSLKFTKHERITLYALDTTTNSLARIIEHKLKELME